MTFKNHVLTKLGKDQFPVHNTAVKRYNIRCFRGDLFYLFTAYYRL